jgi:hypothetical protein
VYSLKPTDENNHWSYWPQFIAPGIE